jgi:hypothetical protein
MKSPPCVEALERLCVCSPFDYCWMNHACWETPGGTAVKREAEE